MDIKLADETLQSIFAACEQPPNTIPFDKLLLRQKLNTRGYSVCIWISILILLLTFMCPLFLKSADFKITAEEKEPYIKLIEHHVKDEQLVLTFSGEDIDYSKIVMINLQNQTYIPISYDEENGIVVLPYPDGECNIFIPDESGRSLHLLLTPKK